ncbi:MAG TPA: DNA alkylation repair protein [Candidatus Tidjanibacter gallistercoris]|nr:DNA alkylation repair protein [Candidatus Tidjanibacter gallistercoris]
MKETEAILRWLEEHRDERNIAGMARFGIRTEGAFGVPIPMLRAEAKAYRRRHDVAMELWDTGLHEARIMAGIIAKPSLFRPEDMDAWCAAFDSWDVCDQCCNNLFRRVPWVYDKVLPYTADGREFVRRTGFVLMAVLAVHDREAPDERFIGWLDIIEAHAADGRNFVRKAVNWALRQTGKRNMTCNRAAVETARRLAASDDTAARWVGRDALRELTSQRTLEFIAAHRK